MLTAGLLVFFLLVYLSNKKVLNIRKEDHLKDRTCDTCASTYFISPFLDYWRCPLCGSINKEDDNRNRNSSG